MADVKSIWLQCLHIIRADISEQSYKTWFEPIRPVKINNATLTIQVPSQFFYEWLEENYVNQLRKAIDQTIGRHGMLEYSVIVEKEEEKKAPIVYNVPTPKGLSPPAFTPKKTFEPEQFKSPFQMKDLGALELDSYLNPQYIFENFVEGECNRLARSASYAVANKPGATSFNPLMIYGGVGLGKTHLVQSIGNFIKENTQKKFVLYVTSEKFTNQFIKAIQENSVQAFTNFYMHIDVLIIDDVQFFEKKERTQEIFFHIFNHLHQSGKQIIMTSDRSPRDLVGLEDRLLSRFKWGLTADLQTPDFETRIAIIMKKLEADGIQVDYQVIEYLAHSVNTNVRELEGVIISLIAHTSLTRSQIDISLAKSVLKNIVEENAKEVTIETIIDLVVGHYKAIKEDVKGKGRQKEVVLPRQVAMYLAKEFTGLSLKSIGWHFGGRDHSTVIHAIQTVTDNLLVDRDLKTTIAQFQRELGR
jgi:chromosomal replication initiator protein